MAASVFAGLCLALAVPAAGHAVGGDPQLNIDGSQSGAVAIYGQDLANAGRSSVSAWQWNPGTPARTCQVHPRLP